MWKESYRVGVDLVDKQHMALFEMVDGLVKVVEERGGWEEKKPACKKAIEFMKNYVVMHFEAEEGYQRSIQYSGIEEHKKLHKKFTDDVLKYEALLVQTDFDQRVVKSFAGMLTAWLIYHVADADQKFVRQEPIKESAKEKTMMQCFVRSIAETLERIAGLDPKELSAKILDNNRETGGIYIRVGLTGDMEGSVVYGFTKEFAFEVVRIMTSMEMVEVDEMVTSAMSEISNIITGTATTLLTDKGLVCDITTPSITEVKPEEMSGMPKEKILIHSKAGEFSFEAMVIKENVGNK